MNEVFKSVESENMKDSLVSKIKYKLDIITDEIINRHILIERRSCEFLYFL